MSSCLAALRSGDSWPQHADSVLLLSRSNLVSNNFIFIELYIISGVSSGFFVQQLAVFIQEDARLD
jgi:hypothetical protein